MGFFSGEYTVRNKLKLQDLSAGTCKRTSLTPKELFEKGGEVTPEFSGLQEGACPLPHDLGRE